MLPYIKPTEEKLYKFLINTKSIIEKMSNYVNNNTNMDPNNMKVVDLGCGEGIFSISLANYFDKVYGIDSSNEMLKESRKNKQKHDKKYNTKTDNLRFYYGINANFPIENISLLYLRNSIFFLNIDNDNIQKLFDKLNKNGLIWIYNGFNFNMNELNPNSEDFNEQKYNKQINSITYKENLVLKYAEDNNMKILSKLINKKFHEIIIQK